MLFIDVLSVVLVVSEIGMVDFDSDSVLIGLNVWVMFNLLLL